MLRCVECNCFSPHAGGWIAILAKDPETNEAPEPAVYCPVCAEQELGLPTRVPGYA